MHFFDFFFYSSEPTAQAQNRAENQNLCLFSVDDFFWRNHKNGEKNIFFFSEKTGFFLQCFQPEKISGAGEKKKFFFPKFPFFFLKSLHLYSRKRETTCRLCLFCSQKSCFLRVKNAFSSVFGQKI